MTLSRPRFLSIRVSTDAYPPARCGDMLWLFPEPLVFPGPPFLPVNSLFVSLDRDGGLIRMGLPHEFEVGELAYRVAMIRVG